jgi:hypothetical protein
MRFIVRQPQTPLRYILKLFQANGRAHLDFKGRRMLCALTHSGATVWATFLADASGRPEIYLHTTPSLYHNESNVRLDDIDYASVAKDLGILVTRYNFMDRALAVWSFRGPMELETLEVLEGRVEGMWDCPIDLTGDDGWYGDFGDIPVKQEVGEVWMTATEEDSDAGLDEEEDSDATVD